MTVLLYILDVVLTFAVGWVVIRWIMETGYKRGLFDLPDGERKIHSVPIPRLGGLAFFPIISITMGIMMLFLIPMMKESWQDSFTELWALAALFFASAILYVLGLAEDLHRVRGLYKFFVMTIATVILVVSAGIVNTGGGLLLRDPDGIFGIERLPLWVSIIVTIIAFLHMINAVNLIDGVDGLSTDICLLALSVLGVMEYMEGHTGYALLALAAICVLLPFRYYNTHGLKKKGEKLFMGDTGCWTLGILITFFIIHLSSSKPIHPERHYMLIGYTTMIVPLLDLPRVGLRRMLMGRGPFVPDNSHIHHKLMRLGMNPLGIRTFVTVTTIVFVVGNMLLAGRVNVAWIIAADVAAWMLLNWILNLRIRQFER